jgi:hypothetical protein
LDAIYQSGVFSKLMDVLFSRCKCAHENVLVSLKTLCYLVRLGYYSLHDVSLLCMLLP